MREILDITYRTVNGKPLLLDLFMPDGGGARPLVLWIHGGGWYCGDRKWCMLKYLADCGYAVASADYRLTGEAPFPACIIDCKHALAYLRDNAAKYGIDPKRVCVAGDSAGGHLAALMGTSVGHPDWEPEGSDCSVQAAIDYYGPTCIATVYKYLYLEKPELGAADNYVGALLNVSGYSKRGLGIAAAASPVAYVDGAEPPFLIIHGDRDEIVPIKQSAILRDALERSGSFVSMHTVPGAGHGFEDAAADAAVKKFLEYFLRPGEAAE